MMAMRGPRRFGTPKKEASGYGAATIAPEPPSHVSTTNGQSCPNNIRRELFIKCFICDATLSEVQFNSQHEDIEPCVTCLAVIVDTVGTWTDKPYAEEEDLGGSEPINLTYSPFEDNYA